MARRPVPPPLTYLGDTVYKTMVVHDFARELMLVFTMNPGEKLTDKQKSLLEALQRIERANYLLFQDVHQEYQKQNRLLADSSRASKDVIAEPEAPRLHLITQENVDAERLRINRGDPRSRSGEIYKAIPSYEELDHLAHVVQVEYLENTTSKGWFSKNSPPTKIGLATHTLLNTTFSRTSLVRQISQMNDTAGSVQDMITGVRMAMRREAEKTDRLAENVEALNETVMEIREQNTQLNVTLAGLNETMLGYSMRMDTSFEGGSILGGTRQNGIFARDTHISKVRGTLDHERWNCVYRVVRELKTTHSAANTHAPLTQLLHLLLLPATEEDATGKDDKVSTWLEEHGDTFTKSDLAKDLTPYLELDPFLIPESIRPMDYYLAVAHCFNEGKLVPKNRELAGTFNALYRQSKAKAKKEATATASETPTVGLRKSEQIE